MLKRLWSWLHNPLGRRGVRPGIVLLQLVAMGWMVTKMGEYHVPNFGFTHFIGVGDRPPEGIDWVADRDVVVYEHFRSAGYDAQYYAQLAIDPTLQDPMLAESIDNLPYRARRILMAWTAYLFGLGEPDWVLNVFALQNVICWLLLAVLLWRWFPPTDLDRTFRWFGVLFSAGMLFSVCSALVDSPSVLLLALALKWWEEGRRWRATAVLACGGLAKETNLLGAAMLAPAAWRAWPEWLVSIGRALLVALPLLLWYALLQWRFQDTGTLAGQRNFSLPLVEFGDRWLTLLRALGDGSLSLKLLCLGIATHLSITVQAAFLLWRWRWSEAAWRLTVPFAVLALVLGSAVWEGFPGAASRVLLPLLFGFNLLVPTGRRWLPLLVLGNLTLWIMPATLPPPPLETNAVVRMDWPEGTSVSRDAELTLEFPRPWYAVEQQGGRRWRWSEADAPIVVHNPLTVPLELEIRGRWAADSPRVAAVMQGDTVWWREDLGRSPRDWRVAGVVVPPGTSELRLVSDQPSSAGSAGDQRTLAILLLEFSVRARPVVEASP